ncbi:MAG TPA: 3-oxoacyl-ACP reductase [Gammaproteobacteria bacterium]|nr:3-oxoacyl-ACP reductase [Gammaproteobacteria bacterium]
MSLQGEIALVTGASRGIGATIADALAAAGAFVIGTATTHGGALAIEERITSAGHEGVGRELDVTSQDSVDAIIKACTELKGPPTILVNNAGITRDNLLMRMKEDEWQDIMDTNLSSVFRMSKAVLRGMMKAKKGRIISITSIVGSIGNAGQANYSAAKAGVDGFSRALAREIASRNITVNTVAPGFIDTDMTRALSDEQREILQKEIPLGRLGTPDDIAAAVMFLASEGGSYITGNTIHVNGGMYMG